MSTRDYSSRRNFDKTSEPRGSSGRKSSKQPQFVIQKHDASTLHYDFRIEADGVLKSWAVPKGPSTNCLNSSVLAVVFSTARAALFCQLAV